jgi:hypothetical protein
VWREHLAGDLLLASLDQRPLTSLEIILCDVRMEGIRELADSPVLRGLGKLRLSWNFVDRTALETLLASDHLGPRLAHLDLRGWNLGQTGWESLASCPRLSGVRHLNLASTGLNAGGMAALLASSPLRHLTALHLGTVGDRAALEMLAASDRLPRVRELVVGSNSNPDGVAALRRRFGARLILYPDS